MYVQVIVDKVQSSNVSSVDQWSFNCDTAIPCYNYWIIKLPLSSIGCYSGSVSMP